MNKELYIPKQLVIGFQNRKDTFTGKLSYITYINDKNEIAKKMSWDKWIDKKIDTITIDNKPMDGFIFNKGVSRYGHWSSKNSVFRVYDPRNFEFEIDAQNLMGILMYSDLSKREVMQECVFAWDSAKLILLPTNSEEYKTSTEFSNKKLMKFSAKSLSPGVTVSMKSGDKELLYLGRYDYRECDTRYNSFNFLSKDFEKSHVFWDGKSFISINNMKLLASVIDKDTPIDYSNILENFLNSKHHQKVKHIYFKDLLPGQLYTECTFYKYNDYIFSRNFRGYDKENDYSFSLHSRIEFNGNKVIVKEYNIGYTFTRLCTNFYNNSIYHSAGYGYMSSDNLLRKNLEILKEKMLKLNLTSDIDQYYDKDAYSRFKDIDLGNVTSEIGLRFGNIVIEFENGLEIRI